MFAAALLILVGFQILCLGLMAEILSRTYYESRGKPIYAVREIRIGSLPTTRAAQSGLEVFNEENRSNAWTINTGSAGHRRHEELS